MSRQLSDWLATYMEYTDDQESPEILHFWVGSCMISAALGRRVYLDRVWYMLYGNIYVLVVGESGRLRKSVAINMGMDILREAVPWCNVMADRMTPEGIVKNLDVMFTDRDRAGNTKGKQPAVVFIHADELASLFGYDGQMASRLGILLTTIYNCPRIYEHTTAKDGKIFIREPYITLLAATAPQNLKVMPAEAVGGLLGRLIMVGASSKKEPIPWGEPNPYKAQLRMALVNDLHQISKLEGPILVSPEAKELFAEWYIRQSKITFGDPKVDAFHERCHDTALKMAILTTVSRSNEKLIETHHMENGIRIVEKLLPAHARLMVWLDPSDFPQAKAKFIDILARAKGVVARKDLIKAMGMPIDQFDILVRTLKEEGSINHQSLLRGGEEVYQLIVTGEGAPGTQRPSDGESQRP